MAFKLVFVYMSRRKTEAQKKSEGTSRKDRARKVKLEAVEGKVRPSMHLTETQAQMFDVIVRNLPEASVFLQIDNFLLSAFVVELQAYFQMNKELQEGGYISHMINGNQEMEVLRKEYQVMQKSLSNIIALSKQLGFDPKTRLQMIELFDDREEEEDPFANS